MAEDNGNGKVTMAVLGSQLTQVQGDINEIKIHVENLVKSEAAQQEFNKAIKSQLWDGGQSRIQAVEGSVKGLSMLVKLLFIPLCLAVMAGLLTLIWK